MTQRAHAGRSSLRVAGCLAAAWLAGCAFVPQAPPAGPQFDGRYVGHSTLTRGWGFACGIADLPRQIAVRDGRFAFPFEQQAPYVTLVPVQVRADGTFDKTYYYTTPDLVPWRTDAPVSMDIAGRIAGNTLAARETEFRCSRTVLLHRR